MTNSAQHWISRMFLGAVNAALTLAVMLGLAIVRTPSAQAQTLTVLYNFTGKSDGGLLYGGLVRDAAGNLYGTTSEGGTSGYGTVYKLSKSGKETVLHSFAGRDGEYPVAGLVRDDTGNLYGTTYNGGASGFGTVFKLDTSGTLTVLHSFAGSDGRYPRGGLIQDAKSNLYGTTYNGGASNHGTVFKVNKSGKETVLHSFSVSDGAYPLLTGLLMDEKSNLYGVTSGGGTSGNGVVYRLSKSGALTLLHSFAGGTADGCFPQGTPVMDKKGNLYGIADVCGTSNEGIVWKVSQKGTETVLHNFAGGSSDGEYPWAGVILDTKGNLYGDTEEGGSDGYGTVYELNTKGTLTVLHSFTGSDGAYPYGGLIQDAKGNFYSTTYEGGSGGYGVVWKLTP